MTGTRTAALYVRISRDKAGAGLGIDRQREDCQALADRLGWAVGDVYSDNDLSAYSGKPRPAYRRMLADLADGRVDAVVSWHPDRLHRQPAELEEFINVVEAAGAAVKTVTAGELDLSTPSGRMIARMLGAAARHEVEHAIERQKRAKSQAATDGRYRGGRRPFGYESDGVTVREGEAAIVVEMTNRALLGESMRSLSRQLNDRKVLTSTGKTWKSPELRKLLLRARNAGFVEHEGEVVGAAQWPAIVDEITWRRVTALLTNPGRQPPRSTDLVWLGSGVYICGRCGDVMNVGRTPGRGEDGEPTRVPGYRCRSGPHLTRAAAALDEFVTDLVVGRLSRPDARETLATPTRDKGEVAALTAGRAQAEARLSELATMFAAGDITGQQLAEASRDLRDRLDGLDRALAAAVQASALTGIVDAPDVRAAWDAVPISRRKAVVRELMTVTVLPAPRGRPAGWKAGERYFDPRAVRIDWRSSTSR